MQEALALEYAPTTFSFYRCVYEGKDVRLISMTTNWWNRSFFWDAISYGVLNLNALYKNFEDDCYQYHFDTVKEVGMTYREKSGLVTIIFFAKKKNGEMFDQWQAKIINDNTLFH